MKHAPAASVFLAAAALGCREQESPRPLAALAGVPLPAPTIVTTFDDEAGAAGKVGKLEFQGLLRAELVAAEPLFQNPVAFTIDRHGRFFVAETNRYLHAVFDITQQTAWLRDDISFRTVADRAEFLRRTFAREPHTLTALADCVRMVEDRDGDGRCETTTLVHDDLRAPECGPIAGIVAHGDSVFVGCIPELKRLDLSADRVQTRVLQQGFGVHIGVSGHDLHGLVVGPDGRLYFSVGDRGVVGTTAEGKRIDLPDTGAVLRCELDGRGLEVFATGLRNPQELAFDRAGNLVTVDNDTAGTDQPRVLHIVPGGDYGWRFGYQHQPDFGLWQAEARWKGGVDDVLPSAGYVAQGPAGVTFVPGDNLGGALRDHFLVCDFPGGVRAFRLEPRGASYAAADAKKVVWGLWPTDLEFGPDGALYVSDWVAGWRKPEKGRIYRVFDKATREGAATAATSQLLRAGFAHRDHAELLELLAHADLRVRQGAHLALAERDDAAQVLAQAVALGQPATRRLHAAWACAIRARRGDGPATEILTRLLADGDIDVLCIALGSKAGESVGAAEPLLAHADARVRMHAALALARQRGRSTDTALAASVLDALERAGDDAFLRHALVCALPLDGVVQTRPELLQGQGTLAARMGVMLALRRAADPRIAAFLTDPDANLVAAAVRAVHDVPIAGALAQVVELAGRNDLPPTIAARVANVCARAGTEAAARALAAQAASPRADAASRVKALHALSVWAQPDPIDPVLGHWRPVLARARAPAVLALRAVLDAILAADSPDVVAACLHAAAQLELREVIARAKALAGDAEVSAAVRTAALATLATLREPTWTDVLPQVLASADHDLVLATLALLERQAGAAGTAEQLARFVQPGVERRLAQAALRVLPLLPHSDALLGRAYEVVRTQHELALDVRAALQRRDAPFAQALLASWPAHDDELFAGGDPARGRELFRHRADLQCLRCHAVGDEGGPVGPALDRIGHKPPAELLQALREPSAVIAEGWPQGAPSAMPSGLDALLSPLELRDLLAYLRSLR